MANHHPHIIKKVAFELEMSDQSNAFDWQQTVSHWFWGEGFVALEKIIDGIVPSDKFIQIDQLTIDLEHIKPSQLEENLTQKLTDQLTIALKEKIGQLGYAHHTDGQIQSLQQYTFKHWLHYLEYGYLPAHVASIEKKENFWSTIYQQLNQNSRAVNQLKQLLLRSAVARKRIAYSLPIIQQWPLLSIISGKEQNQLSIAWEALNKWLAEPGSQQRKYLSKELQTAANSSQWTMLVLQFSWGHSLNYSSSWDKIIAAFLLEAWQDTPLNNPPDHRVVQSLDWPKELEAVRDSWQQLVADSGAGSANDEHISTTGIKQRNVEENDTDEADFTAKEKSSDKAEAGSTPMDKKRKEASSKTKSTDGDSLQRKEDNTIPLNTVSANEGSDTIANVQQPLNELLREQAYQQQDFSAIVGDHFYVDAAGVVLVHPFLTTLFTALELWTEDQFTSDHAQQRAVHLVHYLARGSGVEAREEEMLLAKLLCGRPFELPLEQIELNDNEKTEADNMLAAVIQHWGALGQASPEGIREGFFQREAKIEKKENSWQLTIERKAQDILLGKLPWGLSIIKLPWLKDLVKVTW